MAAPKIDKGEVKEEKVAVEPEKTLFLWKAPARPFKRRDREFYVTVVSIFVIIGLVFFLVEGPIPVILLASVLFLVYVLNTVEPETIEYEITNKGVKVAGRNNPWEGLVRFWFTKRFNSAMVVFETVGVPGRLELVINKNEEEKIKEVVSEYLKEEEGPPNFSDKAVNWFNKKLPGGRLA